MIPTEACFDSKEAAEEAIPIFWAKQEEYKGTKPQQHVQKNYQDSHAKHQRPKAKRAKRNHRILDEQKQHRYPGNPGNTQQSQPQDPWNTL